MLTMRGDGHTAYQNGSPECIDPAVENYLINRVLPPSGTRCRQEVPFTKPEEQAAARRGGAQQRIRQVRPHVRPIVR
jgi:hypothetical protein